MTVAHDQDVPLVTINSATAIADVVFTTNEGDTIAYRVGARDGHLSIQRRDGPDTDDLTGVYINPGHVGPVLAAIAILRGEDGQ